jgi:hypothetical protein
MSKVDRQDNAVQNQAEGAAAAQMPRIKWLTDGLKSSYANFANANSTREEVVLSPFAAKRLSTMLTQLIAYEQRYGELN